MTDPHQIGFLVFDDVKMLDVAGPSEVFAEANLYGGDYEISMLTVDRASVRSSAGIRISADGGALDERHWDTVLIAGGDALPGQGVPEALAAAAVHLADRADRIASVCTGAFILGAAGLLDGRRATTHWNHAADLARRYPETRVEPDLIFVKDGTTYTSAGVTAGIDLSLYLLAQDHGPDVALSVAKRLVVFTQRRGGQSQFSPYLTPHVEVSSPVAQVQEHVLAHIGEALTVDELARLVAMSARNFARVFVRDAGVTPAEFIERARIDAARVMLESSATPLKTVAYRCGFGNANHLRQVFQKRLGLTARQYRSNFGAGFSDAPGLDDEG
jgi:transcriptional regulator GlxA family with amidase domain